MQRLSEILKNLDTMSDGLPPLKDLVVQMENMELTLSDLAKRTLPAREDVPWKRHKIITMLPITEEMAHDGDHH